MEHNLKLLERLKELGIGRRKLNDPLFGEDQPLARLGVYDLEEEELCHDIITSTCPIHGCTFSTETLLDFENHYNAAHRYSCSQCKKMLPSPHLLDLHIQENHDSFFAVMADKKPSYCCYIEECKDKFLNAEQRMEHCVKIHKIPKDFRFDRKPKIAKSKFKKQPQNATMDIDEQCPSQKVKKSFVFTNNKQKSFKNVTDKQLMSVSIDQIMTDLKESLPK